MKIRRRVIVRTVAAILVAWCLIITAGYLWLNSSGARDLVLTRINDAIPGRIAIGAHRLSPADIRLELFDVSLYGPGDDRLAHIDHVYVDAAWWPLRRREMRIESLVVDAPRLNLSAGRDGRLNIVDALVDSDRAAPVSDQTDSKTAAVNIVCRHFRLSDGRLAYRAPEDDQLITVDDIDISASGDLGAGQMAIDLVADRLRLDIPGVDLQPARLRLDARLNDQTLTIEQMQLAAGQSRLSAEGRVEDLFRAARTEGRLSLTGPISELASAAGLSTAASGVLNAQLNLNGALANPDADLSLSVANGGFAGISVDRAEARLHLHDRRLTVDGIDLQRAGGWLRVEGEGNLADVFPDGFVDPPADVDAVAYALQIAAMMPDLAAWLPREAGLAGSLDGRISVSGRGIRLPSMASTVTLSVSAAHLIASTATPPMDARLNLSARVADGAVNVDHLALDASGMQLAGSGRYRVDDTSLGGTLSLVIGDLSRSLVALGLPEATGSGQAAVTIDGTLAAPRLSASLVTRHLGTGDLTIGDLTVEARVTPDHRVLVDRLTLDNGDSHATGSAQMRLLSGGTGLDPEFDNRIDLDLASVAIADFMPAPPVTGRFSGRMQVGGTLSSPTGRIDLEGRGLSGYGVAVDALDASLKLAGGDLSIDRLHLTRETASVSATGSIGLLVPGTLNLASDPTVDLTLAVEDLSPADIYAMPVAGRLDMSARLTGSLKTPAGRFAVNGSALDIAGQPVRSLTASGRIDGGEQLRIERFLAELAPDAGLTLTGTIGIDRTLDLTAEAAGIPVSSIQVLRDIAPGEGRLDVTATATGNVDNPDIEGRMTVSDIVVGDQPLDDIHLNVTLHDMQARATGRLNFGLDAACDLRGGDFTAHLVFDRSDLAAYFKAAGQSDLRGDVSGVVAARGNFRQPDAVSARAELSHLALQYRGTPLLQSDRIDLDLTGGLLSVTPTTLHLLSSGRVDIAGQARLDGGADLALEASLPLADLSVFSDRLGDVSGSLMLSARLSGETQSPQIDATVDLEKIALTIPGLDQRIQDLSGTIVSSGDRLRIDPITGRIGTGTFSISGTIDHDRWNPTRMDLTARARAVPIDIPGTISTLLSADLQLTGNGRDAAVQGGIILLEGLYDRDVKINLLELAASRQRRIEPEHAPLSVPYFDRVDLDISVGYRQPFMVDNNLAQLEITPDLAIGGTLARPVISGRAKVQSGTLTFQGKSFAVKKGVIDFVNPYRTEADIDIESQAVIADWTVTLAVQGTSENLKLKLSSIPEQTDADILSIILFGKPTGQLTAGKSGSQQTTRQIMAEMIADTFGEDIKKRTGVDILEVTASENGAAANGEEADAGGVKVTVGKHLSDRMTVKYAVETKAGDVIQRAITEYQLLEYILVSGFQDSQGVYGSELVFRLEFR